MRCIALQCIALRWRREDAALQQPHLAITPGCCSCSCCSCCPTKLASQPTLSCDDYSKTDKLLAARKDDTITCIFCKIQNFHHEHRNHVRMPPRLWVDSVLLLQTRNTLRPLRAERQKFRTKFTLSLASVQSLVSLAACRLIIICYVQVFVQLLLLPPLLSPPGAKLFFFD